MTAKAALNTKARIHFIWTAIFSVIVTTTIVREQGVSASSWLEALFVVAVVVAVSVAGYFLHPKMRPPR
ncbi:hypothetical protein [Nocardioides sp. GY 10127]|uniref:hypothetical protein n=1 Tax=Nocardioides sp. GY 10127 TaxID=2569762 RepID=UPI0010A93FE5|nr:hypothetical protein [Nocardioides sp. GY 10127]TIC81712.1 hypothetical protein E8D37_10995 [Nocardioides sp. GY 10127]